MAFRKDYTTSANAAIMSAGDVVAAAITQGASFEDAPELAVAVAEALFQFAKPIVDEDNLGFQAEADRTETAKPAAKSSGGGGGGYKKKSYGKGGGGGGRGSVTLKTALDTELTWGAFEGATLAELLDIDADKADSDYGYGDGERDGRDYLAWLASDSNNNEYMRSRALLVAEDNGIEVK